MAGFAFCRLTRDTFQNLTLARAGNKRVGPEGHAQVLERVSRKMFAIAKITVWINHGVRCRLLRMKGRNVQVLWSIVWALVWCQNVRLQAYYKDCGRSKTTASEMHLLPNAWTSLLKRIKLSLQVSATWARLKETSCGLHDMPQNKGHAASEAGRRIWIIWLFSFTPNIRDKVFRVSDLV